MSILNTVNKSPFEKNSWESCLKYAKGNSAILLIEDAVYSALQGTEIGERLGSVASEVRLFVLGPDLKARGLMDKPLIEAIEVVDYEGFVALATQYDKVQAWL
jgi:tRNA 2-thiouridine synthesizing protein B